MRCSRPLFFAVSLALALLPKLAIAEMPLAREGQALARIACDAPRGTPDSQAAQELASHLLKITGAVFRLTPTDPLTDDPRPTVFVGPGPGARRTFPDVPWDQLADEEWVIETRQGHLLLTGGGARGTLYAVYRFLQDQAGVRWWTPWAAHIPVRTDLVVGDLRLRSKPAFEARDPFWYTAFDPLWAVRNLSNSQSARIPPEWGGAIQYKGFVHTFYPLVPPEEHFTTHPEWFSLIQGKRTHDRAQLCLTQPGLRDFVVERVRQWLKESPDASIVSISQNDWYGACECPDCKAVDEAEGSHAGTMLAFVNTIAERLEPEFPRVAFDTLAYQYTRKPPKTIRPRPNVIVRLCSIECDFREPLEHPSNAAFAEDIRGWSRISQRLYIWDYATDFSHYVQPHPNWYVLGPNLRFFQAHHVRGVFEQGAYQSHGSELAELRSWVLAQLLVNPHQEDRALIREFVHGYYGDAAAPHILRYLDHFHAASAGYKLTCFSKTDTPFHRFTPLAEAERLWTLAEQGASDDRDHLLRVRLARLPLRYVWLTRWDALRKECQEAGATWPLPESRKTVAEDFAAIARGTPTAPWTRITHLNEGGRSVDAFLKPFLE